MHTDLTAAPLENIHKTCPHVEALLSTDQLNAQQATEHTTLLGLMPHSTPELLVATAHAAADFLGAMNPANQQQAACKADVQVSRDRLAVTVCRKDMRAAVDWMTDQARITWVSVRPATAPHNLYSAAVSQAAEQLASRTASPNVFKGVSSGLFPLWKAGLDGSGQVVGVTDTGIDTDSCYFWDPAFPDPVSDRKSTFTTRTNPFLPLNAGVGGSQASPNRLVSQFSSVQNVTVFENPKARKVVQVVWYADPSDLAQHGSHVAGTIAGSVFGTDHTKQPTIGTGVAPGAKLAMFNLGAEFVVPMDPGAMYDIQRQAGARVTSNSWGTVLANFYQAPDCYLWDSYSWFAQDMLHVFSAGNDGALQQLNQLAGTASSPGTCKNVLSVGATESWTPENNLTRYLGVDIDAPGFNLKDPKGKLVKVTTPFVTPDFGETTRITVRSGDGSLDRTLVNAALYGPVGEDSFLYFDTNPSDAVVGVVLDDVAIPGQTTVENGNGNGRNDPGSNGTGTDAGGAGTVPKRRGNTSKRSPKVFDSSVAPLLRKKTIQVVLADPEDACRPLRQRRSKHGGSRTWGGSRDTATVVLVRKFNPTIIAETADSQQAGNTQPATSATRAGDAHRPWGDQGGGAATPWGGRGGDRAHDPSIRTPPGSTRREGGTEGGGSEHAAGKGDGGDKSKRSCTAEASLLNVINSGADGVMVYFEGSNALVQSGSDQVHQFPAFTITTALGSLIRDTLLSGVPVTVHLEHVEKSAAPFEDVTLYSGAGSALPFDTIPAPNFEFVDVRFKPDIVAPGRAISVASDLTVTGKQDKCTVMELQGTSMSTPTVAGGAAIVRQYFKTGFYPTGARTDSHAHDPSGPLVKAVLLAGAAAATGVSQVNNEPLQPPPSPFQGYGRLDLSRSLPLHSDTGNTWRLQVVDGAQFTSDGVEHTYTLTVPSPSHGRSSSRAERAGATTEGDGAGGGAPLIVTLVWNDYPAFPGTQYVLTQNLDLVVTAPDGTLYWGNNRPGGDYTNNVERVTIQDPTPGDYVISVRAAYLFSQARPQRYALVALGGFSGVLDSPHNPAVAPRTAR